MCDKCIEIDRKLAMYRTMRSQATDPLAIGLVDEVIAEFLDEKLHCTLTTWSRANKGLPEQLQTTASTEMI